GAFQSLSASRMLPGRIQRAINIQVAADRWPSPPSSWYQSIQSISQSNEHSWPCVFVRFIFTSEVALGRTWSGTWEATARQDGGFPTYTKIERPRHLTGIRPYRIDSEGRRFSRAVTLATFYVENE